MSKKESPVFTLDNATRWLLIKGLFYLAALLFIIFFFYLAGYFLQREAAMGENGLENYFSITSSMGDSIAALFATVIGGAAVLTTYLAFVAQYQANEGQRKDIKRERFENQFYEMLRLHLENVNSLALFNGPTGRKVFVNLCYEIQYIYFLVKNNDNARDFSEEEMIKIAYHHMYFGVGVVSEKCLHPMEEKYQLVSDEICKKLAELREIGLDLEGDEKIDEEMKYENLGKTVEKRFHPPYPAFGGHVSRLSHLYRHLFQMVKRVVSNEDLDWNDKYEYMKLIRAQLSNHEQAMLFWGALWLKNPTWWEDHSNRDKDGNPSRYFLDYALIKNIPFNLTDEIGPDVQKAFVKRMRKGEVYKKGEKVLKFEEKMDWLFEWRKW